MDAAIEKPGSQFTLGSGEEPGCPKSRKAAILLAQ